MTDNSFSSFAFRNDVNVLFVWFFRSFLTFQFASHIPLVFFFVSSFPKSRAQRKQPQRKPFKYKICGCVMTNALDTIFNIIIVVFLTFNLCWWFIERATLTSLGAAIEKSACSFHGHRSEGAIDYLRGTIPTASRSLYLLIVKWQRGACSCYFIGCMWVASRVVNGLTRLMIV